MANGAEGHSPLTQFEIHPLVDLKVGGVDISFTNSALWMVIAGTLIVLFLRLGMRRGALVPGRWQTMAELSYEFIGNMIRDNVGPEGRKFFPFIFTLFMFILFGNMLGLVPYSFTYTSHIVVTATLAIVVVGGATLVGVFRHGLRFFTFFVPSGVPAALLPLMIPIEVISYLSRPVSLSIRLFANVMAGHTMLKVFAGFVFVLGAATFGVGGLGPLVMDVLLIAFELLVAVLQAYVFTILACLYLNDTIHLH